MNTSEEILQQLLHKPFWTQEDCDWVLAYLQQNDTPELRKIMLERFSADLETEPVAALPPAQSQKLLSQIHQQIATDERAAKQVFLFSWKKIAAAAAILVIIISGMYLLTGKKDSPQPVSIAKDLPEKDIAAPNSSTAVITLGNGQQIILDSAGKGTLATQGNVNVSKTADGQIVYTGTSDEILFNTLTNPRGSKPVTLTLSDGTKVWLNSESSLRYPAAFSGSSRPVEITGEAYFEVAKNPAQPFKVTVAGKGIVEVLGTHFNINSYADEQDTKVTLLEGSVKVAVLQSLQQPVTNATIIKPGQQAFYNTAKAATENIKIKNEVNIAAVMAWKNGYFNFENADLQTVMRQLSRWYNVQVIFQGNIPKRNFGGEMQRDLNLSEVLKLLEKNNVHFKIDGNKLNVMP